MADTAKTKSEAAAPVRALRAALLLGKAENLVLLGPFGGQVGEASRATLVASIARRRRWLEELIANATATPASIAKREKCSVRKVNMTIPVGTHGVPPEGANNFGIYGSSGSPVLQAFTLSDGTNISGSARR